MRIVLASLSVLVLSTAAAPVDAENFARFERVEIKEMKAGGKVVGARIKLTLRPDSKTYKEVRIGIGPGEGGPNSNNRALAGDTKAGFLLHQFPGITDFKPNEPKKITLELKYADAPKLKPGQSIQIISAWGDGKSTAHVFGMSRKGFVKDKSYKLPGKAAAQRKTSIDQIRRSGKRVTARKNQRKTTRQKARKRTTRTRSRRAVRR